MPYAPEGATGVRKKIKLTISLDSNIKPVTQSTFW
jgi:hypothetical protein